MTQWIELFLKIITTFIYCVCLLIYYLINFHLIIFHLNPVTVKIVLISFANQIPDPIGNVCPVCNQTFFHNVGDAPRSAFVYPSCPGYARSLCSPPLHTQFLSVIVTYFQTQCMFVNHKNYQILRTAYNIFYGRQYTGAFKATYMTKQVSFTLKHIEKSRVQ